MKLLNRQNIIMLLVLFITFLLLILLIFEYTEVNVNTYINVDMYYY